MEKLFYPDFFNDVFGPIMQPGSSGGFAGPCRIGNVARSLVGGTPKAVRFLFNRSTGALANLATFMSDRGYLGGVQGFQTDDIRLFDAHPLARNAGLSYDFDYLLEENEYPRSVRIEVEGQEGSHGSLTATSIGGGMICTHLINDYPVEWKADTYGLLIENVRADVSGPQINAFEREYEPFLLKTSRICSSDGRQGLFFELSQTVPLDQVQLFFPDGPQLLLPALLPVITAKTRRPQLFRTVSEWRAIAEERNISFSEAAFLYEEYFSGWTRQQIWNRFEQIAAILNEQIHALESIGYDKVADTTFLPIYGKYWNRYIQTKQRLSDGLTNHILIHAFSTNAKIPGVRIVPGPMGTGGGYLFSALDAVREERGYSHERLIESLAVAAALGALAYTHTNASGEVGCVGESGVCCAMASGAVAWLAGGDGKQVERAASMALQASMGIQCDPIPGGLEFPCITRTLRAAVTAPLYADLALSGIDPLIPYHEVLQAIEHHFQTTDSAELCGLGCGCNCTPTAQKCMENLTEDTAFQLHFHR